MKLKIGVFPGSFDPFTIGHYDVVDRALKIFDKVYVLVMDNGEKNSLFTVSERVSIAKAAFEKNDKVKVVPYKGLLVDAFKEYKATAIIKGVRNSSDWDYEHELYMINNSFDKEIDTFIVPASNIYLHISSTMVREMLKYNLDLKKTMPGKSAGVANKIYDKKYGGK